MRHAKAARPSQTLSPRALHIPSSRHLQIAHHPNLSCKQRETTPALVGMHRSCAMHRHAEWCTRGAIIPVHSESLGAVSSKSLRNITGNYPSSIVICGQKSSGARIVHFSEVADPEYFSISARLTSRLLELSKNTDIADLPLPSLRYLQ